MNTKLAIKVASWWAATAYIVCYVAIALFPALRVWFVRYALHADVEFGTGVFSTSTFFAGLVFWVIISAIGAWFLATLVNKFNK